MEFERVLKFLEGKTILVTGATGFLAKTFVEKVLRIQPNVKKLYLLIRASDDDSAFRRMHSEVIEKELFGVLREKRDKCFDSFISEKVTAVCGDVSLEDLGVKDNKLKEQMWNEVDILINSAATTRFDERYDVALSINTLGVLHVLSFSKKCIKLKVLLHVSTAYVCGEREGLIKEDIFYTGNTSKRKSILLDFELENKLMEEKLKELQAEQASDVEIETTMRDFGIKRAKLYGWPNTYVFTKALGEMCLYNSAENFPIVVLRPTMITSTCREPFPGWIEGIRTLDGVIASYGLGKVTCFLGNPKTIMDVIPVDMVVNIMILAMEVNANSYQTSSSSPSNNVMKYHIGSSLVNPLTLSDIRHLSFQYFSKNPLCTKNGKLVKVSKFTVFKSMPTFNMYMAIRFMLPLKILQMQNIVFCQCFADMYTRSNRKLQLVMRLIKLYKPYVLFKGIFDITNTEQLWMTIREDYEAKHVLNFHPETIDWEDYIMNTHFPGLVKYAIK